MNKQQAYDRLKVILEDIKETDEYILGLRNKLNVVLINLKIENAHVETLTQGKTGISPITDELQKIMNDIEDKIQRLIGYRKELDEIMKIIQNGLEIK